MSQKFEGRHAELVSKFEAAMIARYEASAACKAVRDRFTAIQIELRDAAQAESDAIDAVCDARSAIFVAMRGDS